MTLPKDNLNPHFSKVFEGLVWKMDIDEKNDLVALEIRNPENKTTSFSSIDLKNGAVLFDKLKLEEPWFCGIETISDKVILLHLYAVDTSPEHRGILAFDAYSGKLLWENYNLTFSSVGPNSFLAFNPKIEPRKFIQINKQNGEELKVEIETVERNFITAIKHPHEIDWELLPPELKNSNISETIEYLHHADRKIYSLYIKDDQVVTNILYVFNIEGEMVWEDKIRLNAQKPSFDTFFVYKNYLLYIKNRTEFVCYFL
ncbi:hypothetical protein C3K47_11650 [Solitalea longa]|uniref:DUF4905 domain-containing protein n=1 Tax=Solitalea longa TaxID=2079460 RepID=A0A2S5A1K0_9SPHI|nr:DUF4905 domain-containing protein [Solitalea longa]POY36394.1 hypothetical protein C3K47_11650 [Solitalea longa]